MHAWVSLGHYSRAREPSVLRVASLRNIAVWPERPALYVWWQGLMEQGMRLPPLHCCYLGPRDFTDGCAVGPLPLCEQHTRAYLAWPSPLTMKGVAEELLGLVPVLRRAHSDLRWSLARGHPAHLAPDVRLGARNGPFPITSRMSLVCGLGSG